MQGQGVLTIAARPPQALRKLSGAVTRGDVLVGSAFCTLKGDVHEKWQHTAFPQPGPVGTGQDFQKPDTCQAVVARAFNPSIQWAWQADPPSWRPGWSTE